MVAAAEDARTHGIFQQFLLASQPGDVAACVISDVQAYLEAALDKRERSITKLRLAHIVLHVEMRPPL
jgi:hypothetical protein